MKKENNSNLLSENVDNVVKALREAAIEVKNIIAVDPFSFRIEFVHEKTYFAIYVMDNLVEFITYMGGISADDSRLSLFKEGANLTNFGLICDRMIWDGPDRDNDIWFLLKRVILIQNVNSDKLMSTLKFALKTREHWLNKCMSALEPPLSDLGSRMN